MRIAVLLIGACFASAVVTESGFRLVRGRPQGIFVGWFPGRLGLYPENAKIAMPGVVPWVIATNRWGLRGGEVRVEKTAGVRRIAMVGDSITDGFFVENNNTYPAFTEAGLRDAGRQAEVINFARGGATIDTELAVLREVVLPFKPDIVVLTFVTNDVAALESVTDEQLLRGTLVEPNLRRSLLGALVTGTTAGEWLFDRYLLLRASHYRSALSRTRPLAVTNQAGRYELPGGQSFRENSREFMERFKESDARILVDPLSEETEALLNRYIRALDVFIGQARAAAIKPVFVYFPAYAQVYDPAISTSVRQRLQEHSAKLRVPFLDLTDALRAQGDRVLHLAPADYHLNPEGNRVIGQALATFLIQSGF